MPLKHSKSDDAEFDALIEDEEIAAEPEHFSLIDNEKFQGGLLSLTDDPETPAFTFRSVTIGVSFAIVLAISNTILSFRTNAIAIPDTITIIMGYPIGVAMAKLLPPGILNPGDFSIKEHVLINMIAYSAGRSPYGIDNVVGQRYYLKQESVTLWSSLAFVLTTQLIGYGLAGMTRRFLVKPAAMLWPYNMTVIALYGVFHHSSENQNGYESVEDSKKDDGEEKIHTMSRSTFFWLVLVLTFFYELIPNYFATIIQSVSILCFFSSSRLATMLGSSIPNGGFGVLALSFDWTLIRSGGPLFTPFYALVNLTVSGIVFYWIVPFAVQSTNAFGTPFLRNSEGLKYRDGMPFPAINSVKLYNGSGFAISAAYLMDKITLDLNETAFGLNAPIYLTNPNAISYMGNFMLIAATLSHVCLWNGSTIWRQFSDMLNRRESDDGDIHTEMMKKYWDIPEWMYAVYTIVMLLLQIYILEFTAFKLEWWGTLLAFAIAFVFVLPTGFILALTNQSIGLNVVTEFIIGFIIPGKTIEVMSFKSFGFVLQSQALDLSSNLKLGYYMHIPPVAMVASQFIGTIIGAVISTSVSFVMMDSAIPILQQSSKDWDAISYETFVTAGAIWGSIGPARMFGPGTHYFGLLLGFPIGAMLPFIPWLSNRLYPSKLWHFVNIPILLSNTGAVGRSNATIVAPFIVGVFFQYYLYNHHYSWWARYNFTLSAALDAGTSFATVLVGVLLTLNMPVRKWLLNPQQQDAYCFAPVQKYDV